MSDMDAKKRLMYISGEDFYHYCYSIIVILDYLLCYEDKYFRDYRKLAFLIEIINSGKVVYIVSQEAERLLNPKDTEHLLDAYSAGLTKRSEILKLLFAMEKRGYISLKRGNGQDIDVSLNKSNLPDGFCDKSMFTDEYDSTKKVSKAVKRLASLKLETFLEKVYVNNGVKTWA